MTTFTRYTFAAALAATAFAAMLAGPVPAYAADGHDHGAAAPHKLALDHGKKWGTDDTLRKGMDRIRGAVDPALGEAHAGKLDAAKYTALSTQVQTEVGNIVANCKLEPKADAMLHLVIADMMAGADAMAGKDAKAKPEQGLVKVASAVNAYGAHFSHPGFKPIRMGH